MKTFPVTSLFPNATSLRHSDSSAFDRIPCCFHPFNPALHGISERLPTPYNFPPFFPSPTVQPYPGFPDPTSFRPSRLSFPVCSTLLAMPPMPSMPKPTEEETRGIHENLWTNVDPRIPFTTYFLNLTKLLRESQKKGDNQRPEGETFNKSFSSDGSDSNHDVVANSNTICSQTSEDLNRSDVGSEYKTDFKIKTTAAPLPEMTTAVNLERPRPPVDYSKLFTPHVMAGNLNTALFHPAFLQMSGLNLRRPTISSDKPAPIKKYKCDICGKGFSRSNTLVTHKRIHTGDKPFKCEVCDRAFRQPGNLTRHRLTHTTVKPYVCVTCSKAFNRASNLHTHMRTHTNYKPFVCTYCGKGFHQKIDMKIHCYTHTGERPHTCDLCGKGFTLASTLNTHRRTHASRNHTIGNQDEAELADEAPDNKPRTDDRGDNFTITSNRRSTQHSYC
ncbi:zinc finger protein 626-like [Gigantopelta aegis]|uniref:zinc finger protein 626-like n=1 Tax=Gigantopelta aegis TaxID=1735272 RepID=UPI001B889748|nr:zinc finger protein 626-like [Gigantopelta aegis]